MAIDDAAVEAAIGRVKGQSLQQTLRSQAGVATDDNAKMHVMRLAQDIQSSQGWFAWFLTVAAFILVGFLIWILSRSQGPSPLTDVASGRPILMIIIVLTTVVYGGMLLNSALSGHASPDFDGRFQKAREIFLVFSGICATVVGFYFGAGTASTASGQTQEEVTVNATLGEDGSITATVAGGAAPYELVLTKDGESLRFVADESDGNKFTLSVDLVVCPANGVYKVTGANGAIYPDIDFGFSTEELIAAGWTAACGSGTAEDEAEESGAGESAEAPAETTE